MRQKLPKIFSFEEKNRSRLTLSDSTKIRLNPSTGRVELKVQSYNLITGVAVYPTDTDLTVTTWTTNPTALIAWAGFSASPHSNLLPDNTSLRFKLNDGTDDRYWGGASWDVAGASDWNTESEVSANIASFPSSSQQIAVIINLVTTDDSVTPYVDGVALLMDCEIDYLRSILADSVIPSLRNTIRPNVDVTVRAPGGTVVDLLDLKSYNVISILGVYDHTSDPAHQTDLLSAYDSDASTITLISAVDRGSQLWIAMAVEPEVMLEWGSQDYTELAKLPAVVLENFDLDGNTVSAICRVDAIDSLEATVRRDPFRLSLEFDVVLVAETNRTLLAMLDMALAHAATTPQLQWDAVDEKIDMTSSSQGIFRPRPSLRDEHTVRHTLMLHNIYLWLEPEETIPLVQQLNVTLTSVQSRGGALWTGVKTEQLHPNEDC